ncbi:MAG: hypothetical protein ACLP7A_00820 [Desulfobaccales bacterium]
MAKENDYTTLEVGVQCVRSESGWRVVSVLPLVDAAPDQIAAAAVLADVLASGIS